MVELLVVIGIVAVLISILLPALSQARARAKYIACQSNLRQIGQAMLIYANNYDGQLFPPDAGTDQTIVKNRWFVAVLKPAAPLDPNDQNARDWTPAVMLCPADSPDPANYHSYLVNHHLVEHNLKYSSTPPDGLSPSRVVLMGEKKTSADHYYVENHGATSTYDEQVEKYRHGLHLGSNFLYLDLHVDSHGPVEQTTDQFPDPWDFSNPVTTLP